MFKIIGVVVVIAVLLIGFGPLQKWYTGDATPQEAVNEIRQRVGESVSGDTGSIEESAEESEENAAPDPLNPDQLLQGGKDNEKPLTAEGMLKEMMEK